MNRAANLTLAFWIALVAVACQLQPVQAQQSPDAAARQVGQLLDEEVFKSGTTSGTTSGPAAPRVDDETFIRRVYLDIVGEVPTVDDILSFSLDEDENKRAKLVDLLLADADYGKNWGRYWRDVIFYRRSEDRSLLAASATEDYLADRFNKSMSWDDVAASFITAEGDVREVGATGLFAAQAGQPEESVAEMTRIFMGIQIQCAQCHDHPTDRWKREQFHQLAAFLPRVAMRPNAAGGQRSFEVVGQDNFNRGRQNPNNRFVGTLEHRMPDLAKPEEPGQLMQPVFFVTGQDLEMGTSDADRRDSLAKWMTSRENPWFAKAMVNRLWSELVGEGFYEPVDDMGPDRTCSAPKTLDYLAAQFIDNEYDVKWLFRTITATDVYQRESRPRRNFEETPFLANCNQRMRGDQLYSSLVAALDMPDFGGAPVGRPGFGLGQGVRGFLNQQFGYDPSEPREDVSMAIPQALFIMNSPQLNRAISAEPRTSLGRLLSEIDDDRDVVVELYLKVLAREPSEKESQTSLAYVRSVNNRNEAFEDLLWALVNSTEFLHRK